jgi:hypothetical protein
MLALAPLSLIALPHVALAQMTVDQKADQGVTKTVSSARPVLGMQPSAPLLAKTLTLRTRAGINRQVSLAIEAPKSAQLQISNVIFVEAAKTLVIKLVNVGTIESKTAMLRVQPIFPHHKSSLGSLASGAASLASTVKIEISPIGPGESKTLPAVFASLDDDFGYCGTKENGDPITSCFDPLVLGSFKIVLLP